MPQGGTPRATRRPGGPWPRPGRVLCAEAQDHYLVNTAPGSAPAALAEQSPLPALRRWRQAMGRARPRPRGLVMAAFRRRYRARALASAWSLEGRPAPVLRVVLSAFMADAPAGHVSATVAMSVPSVRGWRAERSPGRRASVRAWGCGACLRRPESCAPPRGCSCRSSPARLVGLGAHRLVRDRSGASARPCIAVVAPLPGVRLVAIPDPRTMAVLACPSAKPRRPLVYTNISDTAGHATDERGARRKASSQ